MADFTYRAKTKDGRMVSGKVSASSLRSADETLKSQNLLPITIEPVKTGFDPNDLKLPSFMKKVKAKDLVIFTRQLATLVNAGVPIVRAVNTLAQQAESDLLKKQLNGVVSKVEAGGTLGDAFAQYPKTFSHIYINMVKAGEAGGILDEVLNRLAVQQEKDSALRSKIRAAMIYPCVIGGVVVIAFFVLMTFIVPKIGNILTSLSSQELPIYTRALLSISNVMKNPVFMIALVIGLIIFTVVFQRWKKTPKGRYIWHSFILKIPVIKNIVTKTAIARFSRIFGSLLGAGVSIVETINITAGAIGNAVIEKELLVTAKAVQAGGELSSEIAKSKNFPPMVSQMLEVGEETGKTDEIIIKISEFYEQEVDTAVGAISSIIEPIMILVLGGMVGLIAVSVFGPISQISSGVK